MHIIISGKFATNKRQSPPQCLILAGAAAKCSAKVKVRAKLSAAAETAIDANANANATTLHLGSRRCQCGDSHEYNGELHFVEVENEREEVVNMNVIAQTECASTGLRGGTRLYRPV